MLITLSLALPDGGDSTALGYLLHKHPAKLQSFDITVGKAHVFYPEATAARTTAALMLELDPVELARSKRFTGDSFALGHYVNDRPYASSSMMAVAIGKVFRTAMTGRSDSHPELADNPLDLTITVSALPAKGGADLARRLFAPLGWAGEYNEVALDDDRPEWGASRYLNVTLSGRQRLADALHHLYVMLPVLDDAKHYWVSDDEVGKLVRAGEGWLPQHPERELITKRYLVHQRSIVADAAARLAELDGGEVVSIRKAEGLATQPANAPLYTQRADAVVQALKDVNARRVVDLGCGEGALLQRLVDDSSFTEVVGTDVSTRSLEAAAKRLKLREAPDRVRERVRLLQSSVTYQDDRIAGLDAAVLMEVIEHVDPERLPSVEKSVWGLARPRAVIVTTPNADYNPLYPSLPAGRFRHPDHRFEWTRAEFASWAERVSAEHGYRVEFRPIGPVDASAGSPTQLALFTREES